MKGGIQTVSVGSMGPSLLKGSVSRVCLSRNALALIDSINSNHRPSISQPKCTLKRLSPPWRSLPSQS